MPKQTEHPSTKRVEDFMALVSGELLVLTTSPTGTAAYGEAKGADGFANTHIAVAVFNANNAIEFIGSEHPEVALRHLATMCGT